MQATSIKRVETTIDNRKYIVTVPENATPDEYNRGIIVGPPDLSSLNLPADMEERLHNELFVRGFITKRDVLRRREELLAALQSALILSVETIVEAYNA